MPKLSRNGSVLPQRRFAGRVMNLQEVSSSIVTPIITGPGISGSVPTGTHVRANIRKMYLGAYPGLEGLERVLSRGIDDLANKWGPDKVYQFMLNDPTVSGAVNLIKFGTLGSEFVVTPSHKPDVRKRPEEQHPDVARSARIRDFVQWWVDNLSEPVLDTLWELLDALSFGAMIAEVGWKRIPDGPWAGMIAPGELRVIPREQWAFVVDPRGRATGIEGTDADTGQKIILDLNKFLVLTWMRRRGDPRGTSILRPSFNAWNLKVQTWPGILKYLVRFGTPSIIGTTGPDAKAKPILDANGVPVAGTLNRTAEDDFIEDLLDLQESSAMAIPNGWSVEMFEPRGRGEAQREAIDLFDRQIVLGVLGTVRAMMEAKHGSRADAGEAGNTTGRTFRWLKQRSARALMWQLFYPSVLANFGKPDADRFTPGAQHGSIEHEDFGDLLRAASSAGYRFTGSQLASLDAWLGLPVRDPEDTEPVAPPTAETPPDDEEEDERAIDEDQTQENTRQEQARELTAA